MTKSLKIYTVGHSTHPIDEFVHILRAHGVERLIDIRTIPKSRANPQFCHDELARLMHSRRISYRHLKDLGGLRHTNVNSINKAWHNASFRGYADYMQTDEFAKGIEKLIELATEKITAIMCAEAVPWRCHRSMVADALIVRGIKVIDLYSKTNAKSHSLSKLAKVDHWTVTYPA